MNLFVIFNNYSSDTGETCFEDELIVNENNFDLNISIVEYIKLLGRIATKHKIIPIRAFTQVYLMHDDVLVFNYMPQ